MPRMQRQSARFQAERARILRREAAGQREFEALAGDFDKSMRDLAFITCSNCFKRSEKTKVVRGLCRQCRFGNPELFTRSNNMRIAPIPDELKGLSLVEQILIARVHPVVSVFKIRGQQTAYSGHVMNFEQNIQPVVSRLPNLNGALNSIILLSRDIPSGLVEFRVRASRVRQALLWLKRHNQYYGDIIIDEASLNDLPDDGDVSRRFPVVSDDGEGEEQLPEDNPDNLLTESCFPNIQPVDSERIIERELRQAREGLIDLGDMPELGNNMLDEYNREGLICQAFPCLFPDGQGDLNSPHVHPLTPHKYFKYLLNYYDGRFANDRRFPYYAYNTVARRDANGCGSVFVRHNLMQNMTNEDIREMMRDPDHDLASAIMYFGVKLRGTRAYWKQRCSEITQMVKQLGMPTVFFTLSAADYHWPDLFRILSPRRSIDDLTEAERRILMHNNPATVATFFERRVDMFMKKFMVKLFKVKDFWFRFEWQHRGSPHVHGLLWFEDAPSCVDLDDDQTRRVIIDYFNDKVVAQRTDLHAIEPRTNPCRKRFTDVAPEERAEDLDRLLSAVQRHSRCGNHCLRRVRGSRVLKCRYGFPMQTEDESTLRQEGSAWKFFPKRNDELLQRFNPLITQVWRGNSDFTPVTSMHAVLNYIAKYASKGEHASESFSEILRRVVNRNPVDAPASRTIRQMLVSSIAERNYSAQEVHHLMNGYPLYHSSRPIVVLSLRGDWRRIGEENVANFVERYSRRIGLDDISLFEFAKRFRFRSGNIIERSKEAIVRVVPSVKLTDDPDQINEYYMVQCKLHVPWKGEFESLRPEAMTWEEFYIAQNVNDANPIPEEMQLDPDDIEFEDANDVMRPDQIVRDAGMAASRVHPNFREEDPVGNRPMDEAQIWPDINSAQIDREDVDDFNRTLRSELRADRPMPPPDVPFDQLSSEQKEVLRILRHQIENPDSRLKRVIVQGKAGCGKSTLIKHMCHILDSQHRHRTYAIAAPTGVAANNIDGKTLHNLFKIPISGPYEPLVGESQRQFMLAFSRIKYIIIDEYSMLGLRLLQKLHHRMCEARSSVSEPFGGFCVYFFGDLRQLPPVLDLPIYSEPRDDISRFGLRLVNSIQKFVKLSVSHRQAGQAQEAFRQVLDSVAVGDITRAGWELLMSRRMAVQRANLDAFSNAIALFTTNQQVNELNLYEISRCGHAVASIPAEHNNAVARSSPDILTGALPKHLYLAKNCRVMLRKNLSVSKRLVNGSVGTVREIIYRQDESPPCMPAMILIEFDDYQGPFFRDRTIPILPVTSTWKYRGTDCSRRQFPIHLAYALTIHKSQGLTLDKAVVEIGAKEMAAGLTYVALSRVRSLDDLLIRSQFSLARIQRIRAMKAVIARENFMATNRL